MIYETPVNLRSETRKLRVVTRSQNDCYDMLAIIEKQMNGEIKLKAIRDFNIIL